MNVPNETRRNILRQKLVAYNNTVFDAQIDVEMAEILENTQMEQTAKERMKQALKAIKFLEEKLAEIGGNDGQQLVRVGNG